ncbi:hypothetical protein T484DRAFT_1851708 [Baffinella frigidus]|nr:hypothetical protein T484DRAFT_1851708 [Cryptophyta sp. CCMP2293]
MDFNLGDKKGCLIGNWQEENALKGYCGHHRTALPEQTKKDFVDPRQAQTEQMHLVYKPQAMVGARERLMMQKLQTSASTVAPVAPREWETMHSQTYTFPMVDETYKETMGAKRMRNQDNAPINGRDQTFLLEAGIDNAPINGRDQTFLLEAGIVAPHICLEGADAKMTAKEDPLAAQYFPDVPITVYSANPAQFFGSDTSQGFNPFGKASDFSIPIE